MSDIEALADRILMIGNGTMLYDGTLGELRSRFGAHRTITVEYRESTAPLLDIPGAKLLSWSPERAQLTVDTDALPVSEAISRLSEQVELTDIAIEAKPIDEVIVQLYEEHRL
jgi:ABC-2 type transport system ATP-binding protein